MCHEGFHPVMEMGCRLARSVQPEQFHTLANSGFPQPLANIIMEQNFSHEGPTAAISGVREFPNVQLLEATSPSMHSVLTVIRELAHNSVPVLLLGEQGTGKKTVARLIHFNSGWPEENFLVSSGRELTSAFILELASSAKSTLYLEEAGDLNSDCQKVLSEILAHPGTNGSGRQLRVICGSSRDLEPDVRSGNFQEELYYRLSGVCLRIPPLRQRREDIPHLMTLFMERYSTAYGCEVPELSAATQQLFAE